MELTGFREQAEAVVERYRDGEGHGFMLAGVFDVVCVGADGKEKWRDTARNMITDVQGLNNILDVHFHGTSATSPWYIGLIHATNYGAGPAAGNTMASHAGWEEGTEYSESIRQEWTEDAAASQQITNSTSADFSINATITMKGLFLTSSSTKGGSTGLLWSSVLFSGGDQAVGNGDVLKVTYTVTAARA